MFGTIAPMDRERFGAVELLGDMTISIGCYHLKKQSAIQGAQGITITRSWQWNTKTVEITVPYALSIAMRISQPQAIWPDESTVPK